MAEIGKIERNDQSFLWCHAPGSFDLLLREPLAQFAGASFEVFSTNRLPGLHAPEYTRVSGRLKG